MAGKGIHLKGLNGIRTIAALSVVFSHIFLNLKEFGIGNVKNGWEMANFGVTMFFTLSGFLITFLLLKEKEKFTTISVRNFYIRRVLRIWPLYYLYLVTVLALMYFYQHEKISSISFFYVFLGANIPSALGMAIPLITDYWSLGVEEQFYLFWPWLVKKFPPFKAVVVFLVLFILLKLALRLTVPLSFSYQFIFLTRFDCMAIGALGAILYYQGNRLFLTICFHRAVQAVCWILVIVTAFNLVLVTEFLKHDFYALITLVIIINVAFNPKTLISLNGRLFEFCGKISYGIYIYHLGIIFLLSRFFNTRVIFLHEWVHVIFIYLLVIALTIFTAFISYKYFETPFLSLKDRFSKIQSRP
jgi:peptidoglycan/LPS O-acetylase OafA/YrhL